MGNRLRIGILGGGQLGRMLLQCAANYHVTTYVLESGVHSPAASLCHHFTDGDIRDYQTVLNFGRQVDVLTIEIENVNLQALFELEQEGVKVIPRPHALQTIKDKGLQKQFYQTNNIPTAPFVFTETADDVTKAGIGFPAVHKLRTGGYDGKGVEILKSEADVNRAFNQPSVLEQAVSIEKEISVIAAKNELGETRVYPAVEMVFDPRYNLVDFLVSPAALTPAQESEAQALALRVMEALNSPGIFAVEMFLDTTGKLWVNETAPRAHNSGHQSIEGNYCSQYDMQMRVLQNLPLGHTGIIQPSLMLNLIGEPAHTGSVMYSGLPEVLALKGTFVHLYGKTETKPGRKMGHVTLLGANREELLAKADFVKQHLKVVSTS